MNLLKKQPEVALLLMMLIMRDMMQDISKANMMGLMDTVMAIVMIILIHITTSLKTTTLKVMRMDIMKDITQVKAIMMKMKKQKIEFICSQ